MEQQIQGSERRIPVDVDLRHTRAARKIPKVIYYEKRSGVVVANEVIKVLDERPSASRKGGMIGTRYVCMLDGRTEPTELYWDAITDRWFVEHK